MMCARCPFARLLGIQRGGESASACRPRRRNIKQEKGRGKKRSARKALLCCIPRVDTVRLDTFSRDEEGENDLSVRTNVEHKNREAQTRRRLANFK